MDHLSKGLAKDIPHNGSQPVAVAKEAERPPTHLCKVVDGIGRAALPNYLSPWEEQPVTGSAQSDTQYASGSRCQRRG